MTAPGAAPTLTLLATDLRRAARWDVACVAVTDGTRPGAIARRAQAGTVRRAEPGSRGALVLEARTTADGLLLQVWGPASTPSDEVEQALAATAGWAGCDDDLAGYADLVDAHPALRAARARLPELRLSRLPRVGEALGRAIIAQLVQSAEARRSMAQLAARHGTAAPGRLTCWPTAHQIGALPAHTLRRCGICLRGARALHAGALADGALTRHRGGDGRWQFDALDRRLRSLPGVGAWTSAETRLALGDPDAVSVGDYNLPTLVGTALGDGSTDDAAMLALLAPFAPHRGRVAHLVAAAAHRGLLPARSRRAPRAALSAHRYW